MENEDPEEKIKKVSISKASVMYRIRSVIIINS